ncbi:hypothetical protein [Burkholderia reimsis]|nr:hypothetical protein [Burkholderia reimsis]
MKLAICVAAVVVAACAIGYGAHGALAAVTDVIHTVLYNAQLDIRGLHD